MTSKKQPVPSNIYKYQLRQILQKCTSRSQVRFCALIACSIKVNESCEAVTYGNWQKSFNSLKLNSSLHHQMFLWEWRQRWLSTPHKSPIGRLVIKLLGLISIVTSVTRRYFQQMDKNTKSSLCWSRWLWRYQTKASRVLGTRSVILKDPFFKSGPTQASFFYIFDLFKQNITEKNYRLQRYSNSRRQSRMRACWPLDHHHGQKIHFLRTKK